MVGLGLALLPCLTGCHPGMNVLNPKRPDTPPPGKAPTAEELVQYLNYNARKVQTVQSNHVDIDCKQGNQGVPGLSGLMVCQKPRNFRLKAKVAGQPVVDIGSNDQEFWYWISKAEPPYVYYCSYENLARGGVRMPFPFQPDMLVMALGMAEYDPNKKYEIKPNDKTIELIETAVSPQGQPIKKVTVFNRFQAEKGQPQVLAYKLKDMQDKDICTAVVYEVQTVQVAGYPEPAVMPYRVKLTWPDQQVEMTMWLKDLQAVTVEPERATRMFSRRDLADLQSFDLARGTPDNPRGIGQTQSFNRGLRPATYP
jgi:hypothetical protein